MIQNMANAAETIPYEILTAISQRVKKVLNCFADKDERQD